MKDSMKKIRNFCIIAHIDHGKSTLADRMIELTATTKLDHSQMLDTMELEQERGITIKLTPVRMKWKGHEFNLIDTPGHVDFQYEVSRSLAAVEGVILLVDAAQGVQAQTLSTLYAALENDLEIIPVLNKIDLPAADPERRAEELENLIGCDADDIIAVSAKTGLNVEDVLDAIIERVPAPIEDHSTEDADTVIPEEMTRALIFDSVYDSYKWVVTYVKVLTGDIKVGTRLELIYSDTVLSPTEVGHFEPKYVSDKILSAGQIWYIVTGQKSVRDAKIGDTMLGNYRKSKNEDLNPFAIPGFSEAKPFIFAWVYPMDNSEYNKLQSSLEKLAINDSAIAYTHESSGALGQWFRCGFLGTLHMDIVSERLVREFGMDTIFTLPTVTYLVKAKQFKHIEKISSGYNIKELIKTGLYKHIVSDDTFGEELDDSEKNIEILSKHYHEELRSWMVVNSGGDMPDPGFCETIMEPYGSIEIVGPEEYAGAIMALAQEYRGEMKGMEYLDAGRVIWKYDMPMGEIIIDFYDRLKSGTKGYATMNYEFARYQASDLVRLDVFVNAEKMDSLSLVIHKDNAQYTGRDIVKKLKELIPKHLFAIPLQAGIGSKMIARENISAIRKDVIAKCYGGDISRKKKLLKKQKEGKKRMKSIGSVSVPNDLFIKMLKR